MGPGQAGRLRLVTHAAPRRDRRLMLLDEVAEPIALVRRTWTRCAIWGVRSALGNGLPMPRFRPATKSRRNAARKPASPAKTVGRYPQTLVAQRFAPGWPAACLCQACGTAVLITAVPAQRSPASDQNDTGSFTMPVVRQPAMSHRNAAHAAAARGTGSAPFRCMARSGHVQHAARCMHASALRRLQSRNPRIEHGGPGRWPFHACAICAPPCCRVSRR
ncbi:conserved hypothetical protein [Cupriavidus phytorum]|uniref:Uncharacterized protein n=2 Tax=Cupriavidus TaxID=106589 RepID=A0A975WR58_9BURK|nr:hypothetical protein C7416_103393 [Cupriavidus alkaliphilus]SOY41316.1 conserved hypothetical protein [Cupriavidus taiwanensis]